MSEFKVGDKVLLEAAKVINIKKGTPYPIEVQFSDASTCLFKEEDLRKFDESEYSSGVKAGLDSIKCEVEKAYDKGLNDAWDLMKIIITNPEVVKGGTLVGELEKLVNNALTSDELEKIFGERNRYIILMDFTPKEALERVKAYKEFKVGDVIEHQGLKGVVVRSTSEKIYVLTKIGTTPSYYTGDLKNLKKTGKRINIQQILNQIEG